MPGMSRIVKPNGKGKVEMGYTKWSGSDLRAEIIDAAGGEVAAAVRRAELTSRMVGLRLAELRKARRLTQTQVADRMGVTKGRVSQIEHGAVAETEVVARYAQAIGGQLRQAVYFDDGDIAAIA